MTVSTEPLIAIEVIDVDDYNTDGLHTPIFETTVHRSVPLPAADELITIGRVYDDDGEELDHWHYMGDDGSYERSRPYRVLQREFHYHQARETNDEGNFVTRRVEASVTLVVQRETHLITEETEEE